MDEDFLDELNEGLYESELERQPETLANELENHGYSIDISFDTDEGEHVYSLENPPLNHVETRRKSTEAKSSVTRQVNRYLEEKEREIKSYRQEIGAATSNTEPSDSEADILLPHYDIHFGDVVKSKDGEVKYTSDEAQQHVYDMAKQGIEEAEKYDADIDNAHLILGGDIVTNEAIYDGQAFDIDETIDEQLDRATATYTDVIDELSSEFDYVQVVCQGGNHGEFRVKGSSKHANADDLLYDQLNNIVKYNDDIDNVDFVKSDRADHVNFEFQGYTGHVRHGDNAKEHIGTAAGKRDWGAWLNEHEFDMAFMGHHHEHKIEQIHGQKVYMSPSPKPSGEFAGENGLYSDEDLLGAALFASEDAPLEHVAYLTAKEET